MQDLIAQLKALSDTNRFRIIMMLRIRPLCVCELLQALEIAGGTLSNHLKILKNAGLIEDRKDGRWIEYQLRTETEDLIDRIMTGRTGDFSRLEEDSNIIADVSRDACSISKK